MNPEEHPHTIWPDVETWQIGPIPDPRKGDREWSQVTEVDVECPRCGHPVDVPVVIYATTNGDSTVTMHAATSASPTHNCDEAIDIDLDPEFAPYFDDQFVVVQPYDDTEPEEVVP